MIRRHRDIPTELLRTFVTINDLGGFTKAAARRTVHVVWELPSQPPALEELIQLCREANFKLVVKSPVVSRELFDEVQT